MFDKQKFKAKLKAKFKAARLRLGSRWQPVLKLLALIDDRAPSGSALSAVANRGQACQRAHHVT
jgi:hypothetical protein